MYGMFANAFTLANVGGLQHHAALHALYQGRSNLGDELSVVHVCNPASGLVSGTPVSTDCKILWKVYMAQRELHGFEMASLGETGDCWLVLHAVEAFE